MPESLSGTVALVTGASSGIGQAAARELAARGASVAITARRVEPLEDLAEVIRHAGGAALVLPADLSRGHEAAGVVARTVEELGRLDTVVNAAGVMLNGPSVDAPVEDWTYMVDVNLTGLMLLSKAALPHLLAAIDDGSRGVADLVSISSIAGRSTAAGVAVYGATKAAVDSFTEALRKEFTERSLRVSVISPGAVATELLDHLPESVRAKLDERYAHVEKLHAQDIADAVAYIVTSPRRVAVNEMVIRPTDHN